MRRRLLHLLKNPGTPNLDDCPLVLLHEHLLQYNHCECLDIWTGRQATWMENLLCLEQHQCFEDPEKG